MHYLCGSQNTFNFKTQPKQITTISTKQYQNRYLYLWRSFRYQYLFGDSLSLKSQTQLLFGN